ncbi:hypothetical protein SDC9_92227 [bioreactor metagenome]|uniref:Uncharacterized protein n=1 Tax=bioreactor metagenome TaxID=1076179 RepID=A0A644ZX42_9ZZZZ
MHGLALAVHGPAVGHALLKRRAPAQSAHGHQQRGLEPAAILVQPLQIHSGGPEALIPLHGGKVGGAGVEPPVQRILLLVKALGGPAVGAGKPGGQQLRRVLGKPGVGAFLFKNSGNGLDGFLRGNRLSAVLAVYHRDGQAPFALAGDAPVVALPHHGLDALQTPLGDPAHLLAGRKCLFLKGVHRAEPLGGGPENDGSLAAPAVRIAVHDVLPGKEGAALLHVRQNHGVGFLGLHPGVLSGIICVAALIVYGHHHVHAIPAAGFIVVRAKAGSGVDAAGAGVHGDIVRQQQAAGFVKEGMLRQHIFKERAGMRLHDLVFFKAAQLHDLLRQRLCHNINLAARGLCQRIALLGVQRDGKVSRQGPDGGGPDNEKQLAGVKLAQLPAVIRHGELHVHGGTGIVLILNLRLGQRRLVVGAPVHRLKALIDVALFIHLAKDPHLVGLKLRGHGLIGVLPVANDAHALKSLALHVHIPVRKLMAGGAELRHAHGLAVQLVLLDDGGLDGHAVVIPAGDIGGVIAPHGVGPGDKVLDGLIQGVAHMQVAVGKRRAVVEVKQGLSLVLFQKLVVEVHILPALEHLRLPLG